MYLMGPIHVLIKQLNAFMYTICCEFNPMKLTEVPKNYRESYEGFLSSPKHRFCQMLSE